MSKELTTIVATGTDWNWQLADRKHEKQASNYSTGHTNKNGACITSVSHRTQTLSSKYLTRIMDKGKGANNI